MRSAAAVSALLVVSSNRVTLATGDAVLIECRRLPRIPSVLANVRSMLPSNWTVHFLHGPLNQKMVTESLELTPLLTTGALKLRRYTIGSELQGETVDFKLHDDNLQSLSFWESFTGAWLMLFQLDVVLCPDPTVPIHMFQNFVYVGAPWRPNEKGQLPAWCFNVQHCVGNSGFSLWRRDVMAKVVATPKLAYLPIVLDYLESPIRRPRRGGAALPGTGSKRLMHSGRTYLNTSWMNVLANKMGTDTWMSNLLQALAHYGKLPAPDDGSLPLAPVPSAARAAMFSVETMWSGDYTPVGVHKVFRYLSAEKLSELVLRCPALEVMLRASASETSDSRLYPKDHVKLLNLFNMTKATTRVGAGHSVGARMRANLNGTRGVLHHLVGAVTHRAHVNAMKGMKGMKHHQGGAERRVSLTAQHDHERT
jgi:hypothetical protein